MKSYQTTQIMKTINKNKTFYTKKLNYLMKIIKIGKILGTKVFNNLMKILNINKDFAHNVNISWKLLPCKVAFLTFCIKTIVL